MGQSHTFDENTLEPAKIESKTAAPEEVQQVVGGRRRQIAACYQRVLKRDPSLAGTVTLELRIGPAGQVLSTKVDADTLSETQVTECLRQEAKGWMFESARNSTYAIEKIAREDLGMSKKGEVVYLQPKKN